MPRRKLVLATRNAGKVEEMRALLGGLPIAVVAASAIHGAPDVVEDANTLRGNALKKASAVSAVTGHWALADDTGLVVAALDGAPGVYSARYAGQGCTPRDNRLKLLRALRESQDRLAEFRTVIALVMDGAVEYFEGVCPGHIAHHERGLGGFGYDAIFVPAGMNKTFAELSGPEKNAISHRGQAMRSCQAYLKERLSG